MNVKLERTDWIGSLAGEWKLISNPFQPYALAEPKDTELSECSTNPKTWL